MKSPFLFTKDRSVAMSLKKNGYQMVSQTKDGWTFVNEGQDPTNQTVQLTEFDKKKIVETDKLFI